VLRPTGWWRSRIVCGERKAEGFLNAQPTRLTCLSSLLWPSVRVLVMVGLRVNGQVHPQGMKQGTAVKTVPTVRVAEKGETVSLADLSEEVTWRWAMSPPPRGRGFWR
jgi:hypothetical protein